MCRGRGWEDDAHVGDGVRGGQAVTRALDAVPRHLCGPRRHPTSHRYPANPAGG